MNKKLLSVGIIILNIIGIFCLVYYAIPYISHDISKAVVNVKVELQNPSEIQYGAIYDDGGIEILDKAVAVDDTEFYIADVNNFSAETKNGKVVNRLISNDIVDNSGNAVEADEALGKVLQVIADTVEHEILEAKIFKEGQNYYIAVHTNVNWQNPCDFYQYNIDERKILYLTSWEDANVLGVAKV